MLNLWDTLKGRKEGKDEEIKGEAILLVRKKNERIEVLEKVRTKCSLEELREWVSKQKRREKCERYTMRKRAVSEKKKRVFFTQVVPLSVVISI